MLILLPPSEGKTAPARGKPLDLPSLALPELAPARDKVIDALAELCSGDQTAAMASLGIPKSQPELVARNASLRKAPTARADRVYTGVLYDALDPATLDSSAKRRAAGRLLVASSLFGVVGPGDRIPAYRLSGDAVLPTVGGVAGHWRSQLDGPLTERAEGGLVVDLRSGMYAGFWRPPATLATRVATVRVLHEHQGTRKVVSHFNKATKGRIVRAVLTDGGAPRTPGAFADQLRDLGWTVEVGASGKQGTQLDVIVPDL